MIRVFVAAIAVFFWSIGCALAQATSDTTINLGGFWNEIMPALLAVASAIISAVFLWIAALIKRWTGIQIEAKHRDALHSAAMTGVTAALNGIGKSASSVSIDVKSQIIKESILWMQKSVPDALKYFNLTPESMATLIESKLTVIREAPSGIVTINPGIPPKE